MEYPSLISRYRVLSNRKYYEYRVMIHLDEYESRKVRIRFVPDPECPPLVKVDGPRLSPHRYNSGFLCIWYPKDADSEKWLFADGLLALLVMIEAHLYREAWWRETGEWPGPEVKH